MPPQIASIGRRPPNECAPIEEKLHVSRPSQNSSSSAASKSCATSQAPAWRPVRPTEPDAVSITSNLRPSLVARKGESSLSALWQYIRSRFDFGKRRHTLNLVFQQIQAYLASGSWIASTGFLGARKLQGAVRERCFEGTLDSFSGDVESATVRDDVLEVLRLLAIVLRSL